MLERRARVLEVLRLAVDEGREGVKAGRVLPPLTAESVVGAAFSVIHARLLDPRQESLSGLVGALMATIVLPYRGHAAAARELKRPVSEPSTDPSSETSDDASVKRAVRPRGSGARIDFRPTYRTQMVLAAVAEHPGASNREVSVGAQVQDQGQISKLLARLEGLGLLQNTGGQTHGVPYAWHLTPRGEEIVRAGESSSSAATRRLDGQGQVQQRPMRGTSTEATS